MMVLVAAVGPDGRWVPGIGDPTLVGWLTVVWYVGAAVLAATACCRAPNGRTRLFWAVLALLLLLLGINKQLDLQSLVTEIGRDRAMQEGWYGQRHEAQINFIHWVGIAAIAALAVFFSLFLDQFRDLWLALVGMTGLAAFVVIRASSFHDVDAFLGWQVGGLRANWILEMGAISLVGWSGWSCSRRYRRRAGPPVPRLRILAPVE